MHKNSLTTAQRRLHDARVRLSHAREVEVILRTKNGAVVASFVNVHLGGVINGDTTNGRPFEVCEIDILDPDHTIAWAKGEHRQYDLQVIDSRFIPELDDWVEEEAFTGPLWDFDRDGPVVSLVAHGSERKAMGSIGRVYIAERKERAHTVMRELLAEAGAQPADMSIPPSKDRLPRRVTIGVRKGKSKGKKKPERRQLRAGITDTYLGEVERIAEALEDRDVFCDGRGRFLVRRPKTRPSLSLTRRTMLRPVLERRGDDSEKVNTWLILGANPKGPKKRIKVKVALPPKHPSSAKAQAWHQEPREVIERVENPQLKSKKAARKVGERRRDKAAREVVEHEVEILPILSRVRPKMLVSSPTPDGRAAAPARRWSVPLGPGPDPLVIGGIRKAGRLQSRIVGGSR